VKNVDVMATWTVVASPGVLGVDLPEQQGEVTVPAGLQTASIEVVVFGDTIPEGTDPFEVVLSNPVHGSLGVFSPFDGFGAILNDDGPPHGVPEPSTVALLGFGSAVLAFARRKRSRV
jgi:hypothetical protein